MKIFVKLILFLFIMAVILGGYGQWHRANKAGIAYDEAAEHIANLITEKTHVIDLSAYPDLMSIPANIAEMDRLHSLTIRGTRITNLEPLATSFELVRLRIDSNWVEDLSPLSNLEKLVDLSIIGSWVEDLTPLSRLPSLERLQIVDTQVASLAPITQISSLKWINLHGAYAIDGSKRHYDTLIATVPEVYDGTAFQANYQPHGPYLWKVWFHRMSEKYWGS